jgi:hypothetical protein
MEEVKRNNVEVILTEGFCGISRQMFRSYLKLEHFLPYHLYSVFTNNYTTEQ